ncbi:MAG TPA: molybdate ABC transporter permease subunit [Kofleriaceae bacterium]|nr:molybdate ABC transporter permease subunit [Kofleriaceae bacterium]
MTWAPLFLSLEIATIAMVLSMIIGTGLALLLSWRKLPGRDFVDALVSAPLVLPPTVLGYYLFTAIGPNSWIGRAWEWLFGSRLVFNFKGAVIAATVGSLPLVVRSVRVGLDAVEPNLIAAARTLGARPRRVLVTVTLPLAGPGMIAGAMLGFARALGDYGMTQVVAGARIDGLGLVNTSPASIYTYDQFIGGHDDAARAMAIVTTIVGVTILYVANRMTRRLQRG